MFRSTWYRWMTVLILMAPALVCQTIHPLVPRASWEEMSEAVYAQVLRFQTPALSAPSRVVLVEVDLPAPLLPVVHRILDEPSASGRTKTLAPQRCRPGNRTQCAIDRGYGRLRRCN